MSKIFSIIILFILFNLNFTLAQSADEIFKQTVDGVGLVSDGYKFGSGFFINENTFVTNNHVIKNFDINNGNIRLKNGDRIRIYEVLKTKSSSDLAILRTEKVNNYLALCKPGSVNVGEKVFAIGNPASPSKTIYDFTITDGIINNIKKEYARSFNFSIDAKLILHSAVLNPGFSGGPLLNEQGEVVGINAFLATNTNMMNFAIHVSELVDIIKEMDINYTEEDKKKKQTTQRDLPQGIGIKKPSQENNDTITKSTQNDSVVTTISTISDGFNYTPVIVLVSVLALALLFIALSSKRNVKTAYQFATPVERKFVSSEVTGNTILQGASRSSIAFVNYHGQRFNLNKGELKIGRNSDNDISINDTKISRYHCKIMRQNGDYIIIDLNSKNGITVNSGKVTYTNLSDGDVIRIADHNIFFHKL